MLTRRKLWSPVNVFEDFFDDVWFLPTRKWSPAIDVRDENDSVIIDAELPGMSKDDVKIGIEDNILTISGERKVEKESKFHITERYCGSFSRSFTLPSSVEIEKIEASYDKGVLQIRIPKMPKVSKQIEIKVKSG